MQKALITAGLVLLVAGLIWPWLGRFSIGRLPGDIIINRPHLKIYIPITTMILVSLVVSIIMWWMKK